jgi:hypothetical protein
MSSREDAKASGLKRYFTGSPCKRGHVAERYTADQSCCQCKEEDRATNREKNTEYLRDWRRKNPDYIGPSHLDKERRAEQRRVLYASSDEKRLKIYAWRNANMDKHRESARASYFKHHAKRRAYAAARYQENRGSILAKDRAYREKNRERYRAQSIRWRLENPDKAKVSDRNKKAMRKAAEGRHTAAEIADLMARQKCKCANCKVSLKTGYHADHIEPLSKGGSNWISNIQLLCPACNMWKHNKDPIKFAQENGRLL